MFVMAIVLVVVARVGVSATHQASASGIDTEASRMAAAIDSSARAAQLRADGIAATPMLRAAIVSDGATIADVVRITGKPGEVIEFFQVRDKVPTTVLKLPADAADHARVEDEAAAATPRSADTAHQVGDVAPERTRRLRRRGPTR